MVETQTYQMPDVGIDEIDGKDTRMVVGKLHELSVNKQKIPYEQALLMFDIGCTLNRSGIELSINELSDITGINPPNLKISRAVAKYYNNNKDMFLEDLKELSEWSKIVKKIMPAQKKKPVEMAKALDEIKNCIRQFKDSRDRTLREELRGIRNLITRTIPLDYSLVDRYYIKFCDCGCCGSKDVPEEGWEDVQHYNNIPYIEYPRCPECKELNVPPDLNRLLMMYATYALNIDNAFDRLANR